MRCLCEMAPERGAAVDETSAQSRSSRGLGAHCVAGVFSRVAGADE